jgi:Ca-activated chloride channel family protein
MMPSSGVVVLKPIVLEVGGITESVEVRGAAPIVDTRKTSMGFGGNVAGNVASTPPPPGAPAQRVWDLARSDPANRFAPLHPNTEAYAPIKPNPFNLTTTEPLSTFAADVDTASYTNVRRFLNDGQLPPQDAVRVEEFVNYFHYQYPNPTGEHPVSVTTEVGAAPWAPEHKLVLVGVKAKPIDQADVSGRNIVLLIDVSGSMNSANKLGLVKTGLRMFVDSLRDDDRIAIVVYAGASGLVLPSTPARSRARIHDAIEGLHAGGSTNGALGLELAY